MTAREVIARAMDAIEAETLGNPVRKSHVVVRAWGMDRERFGLPDHELFYPDSNRVIMELVKHKDLFASAGPCLYRLTDKGRELARKAAGGGERSPPPLTPTEETRDDPDEADPGTGRGDRVRVARGRRRVGPQP